MPRNAINLCLPAKRPGNKREMPIKFRREITRNSRKGDFSRLHVRPKLRAMQKSES